MASITVGFAPLHFGVKCLKDFRLRQSQIFELRPWYAVTPPLRDSGITDIAQRSNERGAAQGIDDFVRSMDRVHALILSALKFKHKKNFQHT